MVGGFTPDCSTFDLVYHSHLLEHIGHEHALDFMRECYRVLKRGGVLRVVVPDLETWARSYVASLDSQPRSASTGEHEQIVAGLLEQMVRRTPATRDAQPRFVRFLESVFLGDSLSMGWAHRWMYDQHTLGALLLRAGFSEPAKVQVGEGRVDGWGEYGLDWNDGGTEYKRGSLRMEALKV
jgi:SAM-dependent methyltransferase